MKKNKNTFMVPLLVLLVLVSGFVLYGEIATLTFDNSLTDVSAFAADGTEDGTKRVLIKPKNADSEAKLRKRRDVDVRHEFTGKFSAEVPLSSIEELKELADVEDVVRLELSVQEGEYCGDGIAHPSEECGEPGLDECPQNKECGYCKCLNPNHPIVVERTCFPNGQRSYNVEQVNGGQPGSGDGVSVAVLDTGVYKDHLDLNIDVCKDTTNRGIRDGCADDLYHGTFVTGIVGAHGGWDQMGIYGVAPEVSNWSIKVCLHGVCYDDDIAEAINYAGKRGVNILNMSFGAPEETPLIKEAIDANPDVLYIAAAGNRGPNPDTIDYPGAYPEVVAVAAHNSDKVIVTYSSRGIDDGDDSVISEKEIEFTAGGHFPTSTSFWGCYMRSIGTSFSSPTIAGLAAKLWQGTADDTRAYLVTLAEDITQAGGGGAGIGYDIASGYGMPVAP